MKPLSLRNESLITLQPEHFVYISALHTEVTCRRIDFVQFFWSFEG